MVSRYRLLRCLEIDAVELGHNNGFETWSNVCDFLPRAELSCKCVL